MSEAGNAGEFTLLYFAAASTFTNKAQENFPAPLEVSKLFGILEQRYPGITGQVLKSCLLTVNQDYVDLEDDPAAQGEASGQKQEQPKAVIQAGDEVAIIPPVSSG